MIFRRRKPEARPTTVAAPLLSTAPTSAAPADQQIRQLVYGFRDSSLLFLALTPQDGHLCLLDNVTTSPQSYAALAQQCGWRPAKALPVFLALAGLGILTQTADGQFQQGPLGAALVANRVQRVEAELAARVLSVATEQGLPYALVNEDDGFTHAFGMNFYQYLGTHGADAQRFGAFMHLLTTPVAHLLIQSYPAIKDRPRIVDVGAGDATLLASILTAFDQVRGVAIDQSAERAQQTIAGLAPPIAARLTAQAGNYFEAIPAGDAIILMQVVHNLGDAQAGRVLHNAAAAVALGGVVLIIEQVLPPQVTAITPAVAQNLNMAVLFAEGKERTQAEYEALLAGTGLALTQVIPLTPSSFSIIEATKAQA